MRSVQGDFRERQPVPARWRRVGIAGGAAGVAFFVWLVVAHPPQSLLGAIAINLGIVVAVLVVWMAVLAQLTVTVTATSVRIRWSILARREIPRSDIVSAEAITYHPMREFGGWGIRIGREGARSYSMSGDRAVELTLTNGKRVLLGSLDAESLAAAINHVP